MWHEDISEFHRWCLCTVSHQFFVSLWNFCFVGLSVFVYLQWAMLFARVALRQTPGPRREALPRVTGRVQSRKIHHRYDLLSETAAREVQRAEKTTLHGLHRPHESFQSCEQKRPLPDGWTDRLPPKTPPHPQVISHRHARHHPVWWVLFRPLQNLLWCQERMCAGAHLFWDILLPPPAASLRNINSTYTQGQTVTYSTWLDWKLKRRSDHSPFETCCSSPIHHYQQLHTGSWKHLHLPWVHYHQQPVARHWNQQPQWQSSLYFLETHS